MPGSLLEKITGDDSYPVNSYHHQAVKQVAPTLTICAVSEDGLVEGLEAPDKDFFLGVQWHPERQYEQDEHALLLFKAFVQAAANKQR